MLSMSSLIFFFVPKLGRWNDSGISSKQDPFPPEAFVHLRNVVHHGCPSSRSNDVNPAEIRPEVEYVQGSRSPLHGQQCICSAPPSPTGQLSKATNNGVAMRQCSTWSGLRFLNMSTSSNAKWMTWLTMWAGSQRNAVWPQSIHNQKSAHWSLVF